MISDTYVLAVTVFNVNNIQVLIFKDLIFADGNLKRIFMS